MHLTASLHQVFDQLKYLITHLWGRGKMEAEEAMEDVKESGRRAKAAAEEKVNKLKESLS